MDFRRAPNSSAPARLAIIRRIVIGKSHANSGDRSFHTVMDLRYGAMRAGWGELRQQRLERRIAELTVIPPDDEMITDCANVRVKCKQIGHALDDELDDGDRWIAAALRLGLPLVSQAQALRRSAWA